MCLQCVFKCVFNVVLVNFVTPENSTQERLKSEWILRLSGREFVVKSSHGFTHSSSLHTQLADWLSFLHMPQLRVRLAGKFKDNHD
jgi:hypothetical protein